MKKFLGIISAVILFSMATVAFAENRSGAFSVAPYAGSFVIEGERNLNNRTLLGLRFGYNITDHIGIEVPIDYGTVRYENAMESNSIRYGVDLLYHFLPANKFVPFLAIGGGGNYLGKPINNEKQPSMPERNYATVNYGGGIKYFLTDDIALRVDIRGVTSFEQSIKDTKNNVEYAAGVQFQFGGTRKASESVACAAEPAKVITVEKIVEKRVEVPVEKIIEKHYITPAPAVKEKSERAKQIESRLQPLGGQNFVFDKAVLTKEGESKLQQNIEVLKQYSDIYLLVTGHTSASGSAAYNQKLSEKRAEAVRYRLIQAGIPKERITMKGYGYSRPLVNETNPKDNNSAAAKANRRVVIEIND